MTLRLRADVYPAQARTQDPDAPPRVFDKVRVVVTDTHVYVFDDSPEGPRIVYSAPAPTYTPPAKPTRSYPPVRQSQQAPRTYQTDTLEFQRTSGCGCGSRLKTFNVISAIQTTSSTPSLASSRDRA